MPVFHHTVDEVVAAIRDRGELLVAAHDDEHEALRLLRTWDKALEHHQIGYLYKVFAIGSGSGWAIWVRSRY